MVAQNIQGQTLSSFVNEPNHSLATKGHRRPTDIRKRSNNTFPTSSNANERVKRMRYDVSGNRSNTDDTSEWTNLTMCHDDPEVTSQRIPGRPHNETIEVCYVAEGFEDQDTKITFRQGEEEDLLDTPVIIRLQDLNSLQKVNKLVLCLFCHENYGDTVEYGIRIRYRDVESQTDYEILPGNLHKDFNDYFKRSMINITYRQLESIEMLISLPPRARFCPDDIDGSVILGEEQYQKIRAIGMKKPHIRKELLGKPASIEMEDVEMVQPTDDTDDDFQLLKREAGSFPPEDCHMYNDVGLDKADHEKLKAALKELEASNQPMRMRSPESYSADVSNRSTSSSPRRKPLEPSRSRSSSASQPAHLPNEMYDHSSPFFTQYMARAKKDLRAKQRGEEIRAKLNQTPNSPPKNMPV